MPNLEAILWAGMQGIVILESHWVRTAKPLVELENEMVLYFFGGLLERVKN